MGNVGSVSRSIIHRIHSSGADINSEVNLHIFYK